jgi:hypothetical protein
MTTISAREQDVSTITEDAAKTVPHDPDNPRDPRNYVFGDTLVRWMTEAVLVIYRYAASEEFQEMYRELQELESFEAQDEFVRHVLLDPAELVRRGLTPPEGVTIQRSAFGDKRPTIFCLVKYLPDGVRKATITLDHRSDKPAARPYPADIS